MMMCLLKLLLAEIDLSSSYRSTSAIHHLPPYLDMVAPNSVCILTFPGRCDQIFVLIFDDDGEEDILEFRDALGHGESSLTLVMCAGQLHHRPVNTKTIPMYG